MSPEAKRPAYRTSANRRLWLVRTLSPYAAAQTIKALNRPVRFFRIGKAVIAWSGRPTDFSQGCCFCGQPDDRERVHRAHACEPWVSS